ncbi:NUDIX hydrolase domain-like protein [Dunaliella salina]|uniref:NUDIX hydrolase domain-like protein n=1 Tax=Dunaliella salina TaxID=3046 RepID=A0ABQ7HAJ1_DUNSA|nr:NUDIX hydrolase domain-like protein [Dunaliella salina]|eukprot:KAF5843871.1 NUDIX hydrolase domain-like protein [Dunaliella salina]
MSGAVASEKGAAMAVSREAVENGSAVSGLEPATPSVPQFARIGRHRQRFDTGGERLCAGCIPIRRAPLEEGGEMQVLLVSSRGGKGFGLPKGGWEDDESVEDAARRETIEEAGVRGTLEEPAFGIFEFTSGKPGSQQNQCRTHMFVMHVAEELDVWPEGSERQRIWCSIEDAKRDCRHDWMREALDVWTQQLKAAPTAATAAAAAAAATLVSTSVAAATD